MKSDITVILNGFRRPQNLDEQIQALSKSTIKPDHIMVWYNNPGIGHKFNDSVIANHIAAVNTNNWGVWARFFYAFNAPTKYVCVFDDDTIPGTKWLENCLNTMETHRGLLGTIGLLFPSGSPGYYSRYFRAGWDQRNNGESQRVCEVDFVGHSWFFEKDWLQYFVRELPEFPRWSMCGEDMHFSYTLRKYAGIDTFTPPHPKDDIEMWGSTKGHIGDDPVALWNQTQTTQRQDMDVYFRSLRSRGWKLVSEK